MIKPIILLQKTPIHSVAPLPFVPRSIVVPATTPIQTASHTNGDVPNQQSTPISIKISIEPRTPSNGSSFVSSNHVQSSQSKKLPEIESSNVSQLSATAAADDEENSPVDVDSDKSRKRHSSPTKRDKKLKETKKKRRKKHHKKLSRSRSRSPVDDERRKHKDDHKERKVKKKKRSKLKHKIERNGAEPEETLIKKIDEPQTKNSDVFVKKSVEPIVKNNVGSRSTLMSPLEFFKLHCANGYGSFGKFEKYLV